MDSAIYAEVLALREGLLVAATLRWASSHSSMFESFSKLVVAWVANPSVAFS